VSNLMTATHRPRTARTVLGLPVYPLGILLLESNGWSVGYSLDSTGRTVDECLEQMVRNREVSLV